MKKIILLILLILTVVLLVSTIPLVSYALMTKHLTPILVVFLILLVGTISGIFGLIRQKK